MAENEGSSSSSTSRGQLLRPTITLPPRSSIESLFSGGSSGISPGPMTLVSSFFSDNDPDSECRSFSQLLAGAMTPPAGFTGVRPGFPPLPPPSTAAITQSTTTFTVPPGLSPTSLFDGFFSPGQGPFGMSHQQVLAQLTSQASQAQSQMHIQPNYPSSATAAAPSMSQFQSLPSNAPANRQIRPTLDPNIVKESSDVSLSDQRSEPASFVVDKPADDGYNWRKYGQKQVKGSEYPRSYYKCTNPNCPVKKKVERSLDGQVTEIIYKGQHNHQPPQASKRSKESGNPNGNYNLQGPYELSSEVLTGNYNKPKEGEPSYSLRMKDQESSQANDQTSGSSDSEEVGNAETRVDGRDIDERESKRRAVEVHSTEAACSHRTVAEPRIIVQTTSEVDLLDDGYRWRKYGQKVVKGNPYPRSYYKCTSQGCNVRKHVERAASDPKAVITTYEGKHNHDVPAARNSSHNTANNSMSQLRPHNPVVDRPAAMRRADFQSNEQQPIALLRFKEEQSI
ncbi:probable WRKY transcription factor 4 [Solanum pennellii]|uniref:Probable WRKY transcription factor 4 n=1 Tax=Solanum pennellii TaxID=28526 RepID=A0ABM1GQY8_SOLPN|nr:probable WRKY transcription factor 4 [Solanum pennellii]